MKILERILLRYWEYVKGKDNRRLETQSMPERVKVISDIPYIDGADVPNYLDIYYPEGTDKLLPTIVVVHGGGWLYGSKELNKIYAMDLSKRGFTVVNINYHLAHIKRFPEQIKDIFKALNFIELNYDKYYIDKDKLFITGDSAGGHLASIALALNNNDEAAKELGVNTTLRIKAGGLICPAFDVEDFGNLTSLARLYGNIIIGERMKYSRYRKFMSIKGITVDNMPPLYIMTSRQDFLKSQSLALVRYLKANSMSYKFRYWEEDKSKGLCHVFNVMYPLKQESVITNDEMSQFFLDNAK